MFSKWDDREFNIFSVFNSCSCYMNKERKKVCVCSLEANYYCCVDILDFVFTRNTSNILKSNKIYYPTFKFIIITIWHNAGTPEIYWQTKLDSKLYFPLFTKNIVRMIFHNFQSPSTTIMWTPSRTCPYSIMATALI